MVKMKLWASPHTPLPEQGEGFVLLSQMGEEGAELQAQLNNTPADTGVLEELAKKLLKFAESNSADLYQPGGSPAFQAVLGRVHLSLNSTVGVFYAHSVRESKEEKLPDGSIKKVAVFRHQGWIKAL